MTVVATGYTMGNDWAKVIALTLPSIRAYAARHQYDLYICAELDKTAQGRPPSWGKIPVIQSLLEQPVLWIDADVYVKDNSHWIDVAPPGLQGLVVQHVPEGDIPSCGVWKINPRMKPVLDIVWDTPCLIEHPWWEQAALLHTMGYDIRSRPMTRLHHTLLYERTTWLDERFNVRPEGDIEHGWFLHATIRDPAARLALLAQWAEAFPCSSA